MKLLRFPRRSRSYLLVAVLALFSVGVLSLSNNSCKPNAASPQTNQTQSEGAAKPAKAATRLAAENVFAEAQRLQSEQNAESNVRAIDKYREAAELWRSATNFQQSSVALRKAGEILQLLGNTSAALVQYQEALTSSRKAKSPLDEARILNKLANLHFLTGDTKDAEENCRAALRLNRTIQNSEVEADGLSNLGETFYSYGDLVKAQEHQQRSLAIWHELGNQRGQAVSLTALGYYYANLGEPQKALDSADAGLSMARASSDLEVETLALIAVGNIKRRFGEEQEALESYATAMTIAERIGAKTSQAILLGGIGSVYYDMGDQRNALKNIEAATNLMERNGSKWGTAEGKLELGRIHHSLGNHEKALDYLVEAHALFKSVSMRRFESLTLRAIGQVYSSLGQPSRALEAYQQARRLTLIGQDQRLEAYALNYIGNVYEGLKDTNRALKYYSDALPLSRASADPIAETLSHYNLAHLERDRENLDEARRQIEAAIKIVESLRTKVSSQDLRTTYFATVRDSYQLYIDILMLLHRQSPSSGFEAEAFAVSERARARSFLELLREGRANVREGVDPTLLKKERELSEAFNIKAQRQMQLLSKKEKRAADEINKELEGLTTQLRQVREQIKSNSPRYAALTLPQPLSLREIQQQVLNDDSIILEYALGNERSYVWVVSRDSVAAYELPGRLEIERSAHRLYELFIAYQMVYGESLEQQTNRRRKAAEAMPAEIALLSELVLRPLAGKLQNKRLVIIPDGALQYIPFQMLTDPDSSQFLIGNHEIVNQPSASTLGLLLSEVTGDKSSTNSVAVLADPVFEADDPRVKPNANKTGESVNNEDLKQALRDIGLSADGIEIPRLLASKREADEIMNAIPWGTGLKAVGFAANRETVMGEKLADYRIIHFATHGLINNEHPELSGVVLSLFDQQGRPQDGFLRLHDIYNLRLPADLVVLSACSSGLGKDVKGEGLIGLTRGFMYAGASSVVASLWKVDDEATAELMKHFYYAMFRKGLAPPAALRDAQLVMARDKRWQSPYYWAGFVIQGRYDKNVATHWFVFLTPQRVAVTVGLLLSLTLACILILRRRRG